MEHYAVPLFIRSINDTLYSAGHDKRNYGEIIRTFNVSIASLYSLDYFILISLSKYNVMDNRYTVKINQGSILGSRTFVRFVSIF